MEGVRQHVVEDERRSPNGSIAVGEMKLCVSVELLISEGGEILQRSPAGFLLEANYV